MDFGQTQMKLANPLELLGARTSCRIDLASTTLNREPMPSHVSIHRPGLHTMKSARLAVLILMFLSVAARGQEIKQATTAPTQPLRSLDSFFPFAPPIQLAVWEARKLELRQHLLVSLGLWPQPEKCDLKPIVHGQIQQDGYVVKKVFFESLPGFFVTGNLYLPDKIEGRLPGVLCPHGHFQNGRFNRASDPAIAEEIQRGAETFVSNARSILQSRCAHLAKMGCIVFHYDMLGYADSQQISYDVAHGFARQRAEMSHREKWGLFSPQAESNLQSVMGLQTWNSIRALDFLCSLPEVDSSRIGVTGASGGGTQTFLLCAIDDRPTVSFPAVMVSTAMQGGCTCENCCYLRIGTGNVEIAAMFAPKPMGLTAADDWTKDMPQQGFPELQALYRLYGVPEHVQLTARTEFGHNYNQVSRLAMYRWFHLHLNLHGSVEESELNFIEPRDLSVFDTQHPAPAGGPEFEIQLTRELKHRSDSQLTKMFDDVQKNAIPFVNPIEQFVEIVRSAAKVETAPLTLDTDSSSDRNGSQPADQLIRWKSASDIELAFRERTSKHPSGVVLIIDSAGDQIFDEHHPLQPLIKKLRGENFAIRSFSSNFPSPDQVHSRRVENGREALAYTVGYNPPELAIRANLWLSALEHDSIADHRPLFVVALDRSALEVALNGHWLRKLKNLKGIIVATDGFRFQDVTDIRHPDLLPGAAKYFDLPGLLSLAAPLPMLVFDENEESARFVLDAYRKTNEQINLQLVGEPNESERSDLTVQWIKTNR